MTRLEPLQLSALKECYRSDRNREGWAPILGCLCGAQSHEHQEYLGLIYGAVCAITILICSCLDFRLSDSAGVVSLLGFSPLRSTHLRQRFGFQTTTSWICMRCRSKIPKAFTHLLVDEVLGKSIPAAFQC